MLETELSNIERYNKDFNAFITIFGGEPGSAISRAKELDELLRKKNKSNSEAIGSLFGIPFSIKDNIFVSGYPTTAASVAFKDFVSNTNADVVDKILKSGGVLVGKTNLHELALGATSSSSFFGPVRNPKDPRRISGGSSGGSAVSVALSKGVLVSLGTDTGGSVRIPAALCGVCGFKPSIGLLTTEGVFPLSATLDHVGILTKTMPDMITAYRALVENENSKEPKESSENWREPKLRLGIPKNYFVDEIDENVSSAFWKAVQKLETLDLFEVINGIEISDPSRITKVRRTIQLKEASWFYEELLKADNKRKLLQRDVLGLLDIGLKTSMASYMSSIMARFGFTFSMWNVFKKIDIMLTPTCPLVAPKLEDVMGKETGPVRLLLIRNTEPFNLCGFPALSVPVNVGEANSLPVGIQIAGRLGEDLRVLEVGETLWNALYKRL